MTTTGDAPRPLVGLDQRPAENRRHTRDAEGRHRDLGDGHRLGRRIARAPASLQRPPRAQVFEEPGVLPPDRQIVQQSPLLAGRDRVAHLDLDDSIALRKPNRRTQEIAREVVPACSDADGKGQCKSPRDREAGILQ
jgi:hypothetical protein